MSRFAIFAASVAVLILASRPAAAQQKLPTVAEVLGKLKEKRDSGGIQVYEFAFERIYYENGSVVQTCRMVKDAFQIDWKTGKHRTSGWDACGSEPFEQIEVYDGEKIKTQFRSVTKEGKPVGDGAWKYGMLTGRPNSWVFQAEYWPVFFHKGAIRGLDEPFYAGHLAFDPDGEKFFIDGEIHRDGQKCISLKTSPSTYREMQYEYLIDPKKDYSVVGLMYTLKKAPYFARHRRGAGQTTGTLGPARLDIHTVRWSRRGGTGHQG